MQAASQANVSQFLSSGGPQFINSKVDGNSFTWNTRKQIVSEWLSDIKYWQHHERIRKDLLADSGQWLIQRQEYHHWEGASHSSVLWLHGRPGCGKTNLVAVVLERLKRQRDLGALAYFYCSRDTAEEKRSQPHEVLRSLIRQLAFESSPSSQLRPAAALKYQEKEGQAKENRAEEVETLSWDDCLSLIVELLRGYKTTVVIDALDELKREDRWMMYEAFQNIIEELPDGVVRLFISSRDDMDIKLELKRYANIHVKATDNTDDIFRFIDHEVDHAIKRRKFLSGREIPKDLSEDLTTTLRAKACGMFRWVSLQLQALSNPRIKTAKGFRDALHSLLQTLEESYNVIWQQIMGNDPRAKQIAMCAITWLLCAKKQLSDIQFATAVTLGCQDWSSHINADAALGSKAIFDRASDELVTEEEVLDICDNLIELDHLDKGISVFRLTHLSVREYFEKRREFSQVNMHSLALGTCIHTILSSKRNSFAKKFHHYSWTFWPIHCIELHDKGPWASARDICNQFFRDRSNQSGPRWSWRRNWSRLSPLPLSGIDRLEQIQNSQDSANGIVTIFLFACLFGLMWIFDDLETHPDFNQHLNARSVGARGLILASQYGQHEVVDYLIAKGVSVQSSDESGSALYHAVKNQQKESVLCLLKHGSKTRELDRWKLLMGAITGGNPEIFELLLTNAARVDCPFMLSFSQEGKIHQYLKKATVSPAPIYRILIKHGLFPGNGALRYTIKACDMETLESLLEAGMDPNDRELSGI